MLEMPEPYAEESYDGKDSLHKLWLPVEEAPVRGQQGGQPAAEAKAMPAARANLRQVGGNHYKAMQIEPWTVIDTWPIEQRIGAYRAGALKYILRMGSKDECVQEIRKAAHYCEKLAEVLEQGEKN